MHVNALAAVFLATDSDHIAFFQTAAFSDPEPVIVEDERGIHPRLARHQPRAFDLDVSRKIGRGKEILRQDAIRRRRDKLCLGSVLEIRRVEVRMAEYGHELKISIKLRAAD